MESSCPIFIVLTFVLIAKGWSRSINTADMSKDSTTNIYESDDSLESADSLKYDIDALRRNYAILLRNIEAENQRDGNLYGGSAHPHGPGISRLSAFHGKKSIGSRGNLGEEDGDINVRSNGGVGEKRNGFPISSTAFHGKKSIQNDEDAFADEQNTTVFHGKKRSAERSHVKSSRYNDYRPSRSSIFHGRREMDEVLRYILNGMDNQGESV